MKLRKIGDEIPIKLDEMLLAAGYKALQPQIAKTQADAKTKAEKARATKAVAAVRKQLADECKPLVGMVWHITHQGYAAREALRMSGERAVMEDARELAELKSKYPKEQWPDLYEDGFVSAESKGRLGAYHFEALSSYSSRLEVPDSDQVTDGAEIAGILMGLGLGDVATATVIKAQSPTVAQVF